MFTRIIFKKIFTPIFLALAILFQPLSCQTVIAAPASDTLSGPEHMWFFTIKSHEATMTKIGGTITVQLNQPSIIAKVVRPYRFNKLLSPTEFLTAWQEGANSLKVDHPNGSLVLVFANGTSFERSIILSHPTISGGTLSFTIEPSNNNEDFSIGKPLSAVFILIDPELLSSGGW